MKEKYMKHLKELKEATMEELKNIINGKDFQKPTSRNLQYIVDQLKEIETIEEFLNSEDFQRIQKEEECVGTYLMGNGQFFKVYRRNGRMIDQNGIVITPTELKTYKKID